MKTILKITEIFYSIQGESVFSGLPCIFIRLTGCNLRCSYCDTEYAFYDGKIFSLDDILLEIRRYPCRLVEITGGEPMLQYGCILLMTRLIDENYTVLLETGGSIPLDRVPEKVIKVVDFKCPSSGMEKKNRWDILDHLNPRDELKFVIGDRLDFDWTIEKIKCHHLDTRCEILISPVFGALDYKTLATWVLDSGVSLRFQIQLHKHIWSPDTIGV